MWDFGLLKICLYSIKDDVEDLDLDVEFDGELSEVEEEEEEEKDSSSREEGGKKAESSSEKS